MITAEFPTTNMANAIGPINAPAKRNHLIMNIYFYNAFNINDNHEFLFMKLCTIRDYISIHTLFFFEAPSYTHFINVF